MKQNTIFFNMNENIKNILLIVITASIAIFVYLYAIGRCEKLWWKILHSWKSLTCTVWY